MNNKLKTRNSSYELMRIVGMVLIVFHHLAAHGYAILGKGYPIDASASATEINNIILLKSFGWPGKLAVGLFMLITAWFASSGDGQPSWRKFRSTYFTLFYYNFVLVTILLLTGNPVELTDYLPVYTRVNWYVNGFLLLMLLLPTLMSGIDRLTERNHRILCLLFLVLDMLPWRWSSHFWAFETVVPIDAIEMIFMVFIAQYIKKYNPKICRNRTLCLAVSLFLIVFITAFYFAVFKIGMARGVAQTTLDNIADSTSALFPIISIGMFLYMKDINIGCSKVINYIAEITFGMYLFHDNIHFRSYMWDIIMPHMPTVAQSTVSILLAGLVLSVVFFLCALVLEAIRRNLFLLAAKARRGNKTIST